jgi:hypothetical protein
MIEASIAAAAIRRHLDNPLGLALRRLFARLDEAVPTSRPVPVFMAGGMAVHLYTGSRVTHDVDAEFAAPRLRIPDLSVPVGDAVTGEPLFFDLNYNPAFALLHREHHDASIPLQFDTRHFLPRVLHPLDLATSKLSRWAAVDRDDIAALARAGLVNADDLARRATEALEDLITDPALVRVNNIREAVELVARSV